MKPNEKQLRVIQAVEQCCKDWKQSNDINSPSHYSLIQDEVEAIGFDDLNFEIYLENSLLKIYNLIKNQ